MSEGGEEVRPTGSVDERRNLLNNASLVLVAAILSLAAFTLLGPVLKPFLVALFLMFMIRPAADGLVRRGLRPWIAWLSLFGVVVLAGAGLTQVAYSNAVQFREQSDEYRERLLERASEWSGRPIDELRRLSINELVDTQALFQYSFGLAANFVEVALMVFFYLLFAITDAPKFPARIRRAFADETADHLVDNVGRTIVDSITGYVRVKTLVSMGMAVTAAAIMMPLGVPFWELWALLTFLLNYVTYVGSLIVLVPPIALSLAILSPEAAIAVAVLLCVNRFVWIDYVETKYSGRKLHVNAVLILLSLAYWGRFWGVLGLILAVPMLTCAKIVMLNFESTKRWAVLMSDD